MKVLWIIIVAVIICLAGAGATFVSNGNNEEVSVEEATSLLNQAVACAQARDFDKLCDLGGSKGICRSQLELAGGEQAVPAEPPEIVDTYLLPTVHLKWGGEIVGGRVLVVEGVDGLGKPYRTEFFVFWTGGDWGLKKELAVTNVVYWSGFGIVQHHNEDGSITTGHPNPRPEVE